MVPVQISRLWDFTSQSQCCILRLSSNHGISPNDSVKLQRLIDPSQKLLRLARGSSRLVVEDLCVGNRKSYSRFRLIRSPSRRPFVRFTCSSFNFRRFHLQFVFICDISTRARAAKITQTASGSDENYTNCKAENPPRLDTNCKAEDSPRHELQVEEAKIA